MKLRLPLFLALALGTGSVSAWGAPQFLTSDNDAILAANLLDRVRSFVNSSPGQALFAGKFALGEFNRQCDESSFEFVAGPLVDRRGETRCFLNRDGSDVILIRDAPECRAALQDASAAVLVNLLHEVLNQMNIEKPDSVVGSVYDVSRLLLKIEFGRIMSEQEFILHPTCDLWGSYTTFDNADTLGILEEKFLAAKGYRYHGIWPAEDPQYVYVYKREGPGPKLPDVTEKPLILDMDMDWNIFTRKGYLGVSVWLAKKDYDPWRTRLDPENRRLYGAKAKAKVRVKDHRGYQSEVFVRKIRDPLTNGLPRIPDCVRVPLRNPGGA